MSRSRCTTRSASTPSCWQGSRPGACFSDGRASIFLGSVSAGLIALGFAAQGGDSAATMRAFALVLFPVLVILGLSTFERVLQVLIEDLALAIRINRIRRFYLRKPGRSSLTTRRWGWAGSPRRQATRRRPPNKSRCCCWSRGRPCWWPTRRPAR
jgi:hypothetical protein